MSEMTDEQREEIKRLAIAAAKAGEARLALEAAIAALGKPAEPWVRESAAGREAMTVDMSCRAPFLSWADMAEIERALILAPLTESTAAALHHVREELDRGEKLGVFSDRDRGRPHPKPLRRYAR